MKVRKLTNEKRNSTDIHLQVASTETIEDFDKSKITEALIEEANLEEKIAKQVANEAEQKISLLELDTVPVSLIRDFVNVELAKRGLEKKLFSQRVLGIPVYDLESALFEKSAENSNITANNPEAVNLFIAETTLKQYALKNVFSKEVSDAHLMGILHLHDLGFVSRVYCSSHSLEYLKKYGLELENLQTVSRPASHARTLTGHLQTFLASMQAYYAGALGIGYINVFYAPYLKGMSFREMKQEAQYLIFSGSQNAFSRGGQTLFLDFNIHTGVPKYFKKLKAIGPGGKYLEQTYEDFEEEAQAFCRALLEVWLEGDKDGKVFAFPKCDFHVSQETFDDPKQYELFKFACHVAAENGSPYFVFDRDEVTLAACCRLRTTITDNYMIEHPESMRFCGFQNITINLPQAAYRAEGSVDKTLEEIEWAMDIAMKAHLQKKRFIKSLMKPGLPLWQIGKTAIDGRPYIDLDAATYIIGMLGLDECVKRIIGKHLHEGDEAYKLGIRIISAMNLKAKKLSKEQGLKVSLEESPAESAAYRLAKVDLIHYKEAKNFVKGNLDTGVVYYTNSCHYIPDAPITIFERIEGQSKFNPLIESGAITHVFLGEQKPTDKAIESLVSKTWHNTQCAQLTISPEFTICNNCRKVTRGWNRGKEVIK